MNKKDILELSKICCRTASKVKYLYSFSELFFMHVKKASKRTVRPIILEFLKAIAFERQKMRKKI